MPRTDTVPSACTSRTRGSSTSAWRRPSDARAADRSADRGEGDRGLRAGNQARRPAARRASAAARPRGRPLRPGPRGPHPAGGLRPAPRRRRVRFPRLDRPRAPEPVSGARARRRRDPRRGQSRPLRRRGRPRRARGDHQRAGVGHHAARARPRAARHRDGRVAHAHARPRGGRVRPRDRQRAARGRRVAAPHARTALRAAVRARRGRARARTLRRARDAHDGPEPARRPRPGGGAAARAPDRDRRRGRAACALRRAAAVPVDDRSAPTPGPVRGRRPARRRPAARRAGEARAPARCKPATQPVGANGTPGRRVLLLADRPAAAAGAPGRPRARDGRGPEHRRAGAGGGGAARSVIAVTATIAVSLLVGMGAERRFAGRAQGWARAVLSLTLYGLLPFVAFFNVARLTVSVDLAAAMGLAIAVAAAVAGIAWLVTTRVLRASRPTVGSVLGAGALGKAIAYDAILSVATLLIGGAAIGAALGEHAGIGTRQRVRAFVVRNPPLIAVILGLLAPDSLAPQALVDISHVMAVALAPLGFFALGAILAGEAERAIVPRMTPPVGAAVALKVLVTPLLLLAVTAPLVALPRAFLLQAAMPCGINGLVIAHAYGLELRTSAGAIA